MIAAVGGASAVLIVAEPIVSGHHDMERVVQLAAHFNIPTMVCVNKFDLNAEVARQIESNVRKNGLTWVGGIPFDPIFTRAMVEGQALFEHTSNSKAGDAVRAVWTKIADKL
ncbi:hypothetical protein ACFL7E_04775 [Thermodesulfobacteriota bacterium]